MSAFDLNGHRPPKQNNRPKLPCPLQVGPPIIYGPKVLTLPNWTQQGGFRADTKRFYGLRDLRSYRVHCDGGVGAECAATSSAGHQAKNSFADGRSDAGLCNDKYGSGNRSGSDGCAAYASGNRIELCLGRRLRATRTRSTDSHVESGRWFPNSSRNPPCWRQARRQEVKDRDHICRGEGQAARVSSSSLIRSRMLTPSK